MIAPPRRDLEPFNVLAVHLKLAAPFEGSMSTRMEHTTRSPGMETNDSRVSVLHFNQPRRWTGWQRILLPAENLVAIGFPDRWALETVLFEGVTAVDTTLAEIDGRWWLFANLADEGASKNDELHLFSADSPLGPWRPHRANPVVSDVRSARPAGRLFRWNGAWYRPSQDCSERYGGALNLMELVSLTPEHYAERPAGRLEPGPKTGWRGVHSLTGDSEITVIDALRSVPRRP